MSKPIDHRLNTGSTEARRRGRKPTYINAFIVIGASKFSVWVRDISDGGALIFLEHDVKVGDRVTFTAENVQRGAVVQWIDYPLAGLEFDGGPGFAMPSKEALALAKKRAALRAIAPENATASRATAPRGFGVRK